jgi:outer membrane protein assembly factor BamB
VKIDRKKSISTAIAILLLSTLSASLVLTQTATAHTPPWTIQTYAYIEVNPNPVGAGQRVDIVAWVDWTMPGATIDNDIRFADYTVTVTEPNGQIQTINMPTSDPTSSSYYIYYPDQTGNYTFVFSHPDQQYTWTGQYSGDTFLGATSKTVTITVQDEPVAQPPTYPLPTEYWTRPIEGQNTNWYTVASNWLGAPYIAGNPQHTMYQPDGVAPNSAHVMWTYRLSDSGVVGGSNVGVPGNTFYQGETYNPRFLNPLIMNGRLFFDAPFENAGGGGGYKALDLRTGQEIWSLNTTGVGVPSFGFYYDLETPNQHGVVPDGTLFATSGFGTQTWHAIDPRTGTVATGNITNVPSGTAAVGPNGEILRYQIDTRNGWLAQWNSSRLLPSSSLSVSGWDSNSIDASTPDRYDWNVTLPDQIPTSTSIQYANAGDILLGGTSFAGFSSFLTPDPYTMWAINLNASVGPVGSLLWIQNYTAPAGNVTRRLAGIDPVNRVFIFCDKETFLFSAYSLDDGSFKWQTKSIEGESDFDYYNMATVGLTPCVAYGRLYNAGWGGLLACYNTTDGSLLWTYGNGGEGNSTNSGLATAFGSYPLFIYAVADGKVYMMSSEHSPNTPMWKGGVARAVDAYTGKEVFTIDAFGGQLGREGHAVADGFWVFYNYYDGQIYCIGKGPSATTVTAPSVSIELGKSLVIRGSVTDIAAGTMQNEQAARFPNGVPAVSDASESAWMEYVYMQKPLPTDVIGVTVSISVVDSNGNCRTIGNATSDSSGMFTLSWTPDIEGNYTVYATFAGSESYWPSSAETSFVVDPAPAVTPAPTPMPESAADLYFVPAVIGIVIAIVAVGAALALLMLRKRS